MDLLFFRASLLILPVFDLPVVARYCGAIAAIGNGQKGDFDSLLYRGNAAVNGCDDLLASGFYFGFGNVCY